MQRLLTAKKPFLRVALAGAAALALVVPVTVAVSATTPDQAAAHGARPTDEVVVDRKNGRARILMKFLPDGRVQAELHYRNLHPVSRRYGMVVEIEEFCAKGCSFSASPYRKGVLRAGQATAVALPLRTTPGRGYRACGYVTSSSGFETLRCTPVRQL